MTTEDKEFSSQQYSHQPGVYTRAHRSTCQHVQGEFHNAPHVDEELQAISGCSSGEDNSEPRFLRSVPSTLNTGTYGQHVGLSVRLSISIIIIDEAKFDREW